MKEFIFTWSIENFSYSWHRNQNYIKSHSFVARTLQNTIWNLRLYPRGNLPRAGSDFDNFLSLYLFRDDFDVSKIFTFGYEFSCVSANNLILTSFSSKCLESVQKYPVQRAVGCQAFLRRSEVFGPKKDLYLPQDTLTLRCRMWKSEGYTDKFGQCFCRTLLEIERIVAVADMHPNITKEKTILMNLENQNKLLMTVNVSQEKENLKVRFDTINSSFMKFCTLKFSALGRNRTPINYMDSFLIMPLEVAWTMPIGNMPFKNKLKLTCEFVYSTGEEKSSMVMVRPCSFKFSEFSTNSILSCIPNGKLSDCPSLCKDLWDSYWKQILCDVELKTQSVSFWVHKAVLCARSPVFLVMFTYEMMEKTSSFVQIQDLENDTLEKLICFFYTDNFEETQWNAVAELYYAADKYQVDQLKSLCSSFFANSLDDNNVCDLLILADRHNDLDLKSKAESYILGHGERLFKLETWMQFSEKQPLLAVRTMLNKYDSIKQNEIFSKTQYRPPRHTTCLEDFRSLYQSQALSDIVIRSTGAQFPAHKAILCASSSRLRIAIAESGESANSLEMEDLADDTVSRLLLFLYTDSLREINWEDAAKLYHAAVVYEIERLKVQCSCFFLENLNASNAVGLLELAREHRDGRLESIVKDFISLHDREITLPEGRPETRKTDPPKRMETRLSKRIKLENKSCDS